MKIILLLSALLLNMFLFAECIKQKKLLGSQVKKISQVNDVWISKGSGRYLKLNNPSSLINSKKYLIQYHDHNTEGPLITRSDYNDVNLTYYTTSRLKKYLKGVSPKFSALNYKILKIGKSIKGEPLFYIGPKKLSKEKKTIVMFGRHHGDEGTANWIIEGFVSFFLKTPRFHEQFNLILYPMVNPDGANSKTRYNANGRDLNRSWGPTALRSFDEIKVIYAHLEKVLPEVSKPDVVLDMHGSFTRDFIFRVKKNFKSPSFYNIQQKFIGNLGKFDRWQNGNFQLSNGNPGMSRIRLVNRFSLNALTHETPRDIAINNPEGRSIKSLNNQGVAAAKTILKIY